MMTRILLITLIFTGLSIATVINLKCSFASDNAVCLVPAYKMGLKKTMTWLHSIPHIVLPSVIAIFTVDVWYRTQDLDAPIRDGLRIKAILIGWSIIAVIFAILYEAGLRLI